MKNKNIAFIIIGLVLVSGVYFIAQNQTTLLEAEGKTSIGTKVGDLAPDFTYTTVDGKTVNSSALDSHVIVITSSAAWCPTCVSEAQQFSPVYEKYKDRNVTFITVDIDPRNTKEAITQLKKIANTPWDYADASGGREIINKYKLDRFEITYIIDTDGAIRFKDNVITSTEQLDQEINNLLL